MVEAAASSAMPRMSIQERIKAMNLAIDDNIADPAAQPVALSRLTAPQPREKRPSVVDMWRKREENSPKNAPANKSNDMHNGGATAGTSNKPPQPQPQKPVKTNSFQSRSQQLAAQLSKTNDRPEDSSFEEKKDQEYDHQQQQRSEQPVQSHQYQSPVRPSASTTSRLNPDESLSAEITYLPVEESPQRPAVASKAAWAKKGLQNVHLSPVRNQVVDPKLKAHVAAPEVAEDDSPTKRMSVKDMWKKRASGAAAIEPAAPQWDSSSSSRNKPSQTPPLHSSPKKPLHNKAPVSTKAQTNSWTSKQKEEVGDFIPSGPVILHTKPRPSPKPSPSAGANASPFGELKTEWARRESEKDLEGALVQPELGGRETGPPTPDNTNRAEVDQHAEHSTESKVTSEQNSSFTRSRAPSRNQLRREALAKHKAKNNGVAAPWRSNKVNAESQQVSDTQASSFEKHYTPLAQNGKKKQIMVAKQTKPSPRATAHSGPDDFSVASDALSEAFGDVMHPDNSEQEQLTHPAFPIKTLLDTGNGGDQFYHTNAADNHSRAQPLSPLSPGSEYASLCVADSDSFAVDHDTTFSPKGPGTPGGGDSIFSSISKKSQQSGGGSNLNRRANEMMKRKHQQKKEGYNRPTDMSEIPSKKLGAKSAAQNPDEFSDIMGSSPTSSYRYDMGQASPEASALSYTTGPTSTATGTTGNADSNNRKSSFGSEMSAGSDSNFASSCSMSDDSHHRRQREKKKNTLSAEASRVAMKHLDKASRTMVTDNFVSESEENTKALQKAYESISFEQIARDIKEEVSDLNLPSFDLSMITSNLKIGPFSFDGLVGKEKSSSTPKNLKVPEVKESFPVEEGVAIEVEYIESDEESSGEENGQV